MAHQIPHILNALVIIGIFGTTVLAVFFSQSASVDASVAPTFRLIPVFGLLALLITILVVASKGACKWANTANQITSLQISAVGASPFTTGISNTGNPLYGGHIDIWASN